MKRIIFILFGLLVSICLRAGEPGQQSAIASVLPQKAAAATKPVYIEFNNYHLDHYGLIKVNRQESAEIDVEFFDDNLNDIILQSGEYLSYSFDGTDGGIVSITDGGKTIMGKKVGEQEMIATLVSDRYTATKKFTVRVVPRLQIEVLTTEVAAGETKSIETTFSDFYTGVAVNFGPSDGEVVWSIDSSDIGVLSLTSTGDVTGRHLGGQLVHGEIRAEWYAGDIISRIDVKHGKLNIVTAPVSVTVGDTKTLTPSLRNSYTNMEINLGTAGGSYRYSLVGTDNGVITVNSMTGEITAMKGGEATVRISLVNSIDYTADPIDVKVTVNKIEVDVYPNKFAPLEIEYGDAVMIPVVIRDPASSAAIPFDVEQGKIVYSLKDPATDVIALLRNGQVRGLRPGETTVVVGIESPYYTATPQELKVNVSKRTVTIEGYDGEPITVIHGWQTATCPELRVYDHRLLEDVPLTPEKGHFEYSVVRHDPHIYVGDLSGEIVSLTTGDDGVYVNLVADLYRAETLEIKVKSYAAWPVSITVEPGVKAELWYELEGKTYFQEELKEGTDTYLMWHFYPREANFFIVASDGYELGEVTYDGGSFTTFTEPTADTPFKGNYLTVASKEDTKDAYTISGRAAKRKVQILGELDKDVILTKSKPVNSPDLVVFDPLAGSNVELNGDNGHLVYSVKTGSSVTVDPLTGVITYRRGNSNATIEVTLESDEYVAEPVTFNVRIFSGTPVSITVAPGVKAELWTVVYDTMLMWVADLNEGTELYDFSEPNYIIAAAKGYELTEISHRDGVVTTFDDASDITWDYLAGVYNRVEGNYYYIAPHSQYGYSDHYEVSGNVVLPALTMKIENPTVPVFVKKGETVPCPAPVLTNSMGVPVELDPEDGHFEYSVAAPDKGNISVNPQTGEITGLEDGVTKVVITLVSDKYRSQPVEVFVIVTDNADANLRIVTFNFTKPEEINCQNARAVGKVFHFDPTAVIPAHADNDVLLTFDGLTNSTYYSEAGYLHVPQGETVEAGSRFKIHFSNDAIHVTRVEFEMLNAEDHTLHCTEGTFAGNVWLPQTSAAPAPARASVPVKRAASDLTRSVVFSPTQKDHQIQRINVSYAVQENQTGVEDVTCEGEAEFYTLQGIKVTNPAAGVYIRVRGTVVDKVLIK